MLFQLEGIQKSYGPKTVLDLPELAIEEGQIHGLLGPNGAGKTTLLEILAMLVPPTKGRILYRSQPVGNSEKERRRLRSEIVLIPQTPIMFSRSVLENVGYGPKIRGIPNPERSRIVDRCLGQVGLRHLAGEQASKLSGGETQRVAIARALACSPKVVLFDEPTANVDVEHRIAIENLIMEIGARSGLTVLLTTHDMIQATRLTRNAIFLFEGRATSMVYENIFSGYIFEKGNRCQCRIQDRLSAPIRTEIRGPARISINPARLKIEHTASGKVPGEVFWPGKVLQVTEAGTGTRVLIDVGLPLSLF